MKIVNKIIFSSHIFLLYIICIKSYIILPFKEIIKDEVYDFRDVDELLNDISYLNLYSDFYLGSSPHKLPLIFKPNIDYFVITKNNEEQLKSKDNYNPSTSESLKTIEPENKLIFDNQEFSYISETFNFLMTEGDLSSIYSDKSRGKIDANKYHSFINIYCLKSETEKISNYCGILGFSYPNINNVKNNFINELYKKSLIDSTIWSVDFPDIDEDTFKKGYIIIGELPHIYNSEYYSKNQYFKMKIPKKNINDTNNGWEINIDSATIIKKYYDNLQRKEMGTSMPYLKTISIEFGRYMIYAPKELFEQLKDLYFNNLFDGGICDYKKINTDEYDKIIVVFCNKKSFDKNEQMNFPTISFDIQALGGSFKLDYKDLFMTKKDKVFLLIAFSSKEIENTIKLGQIFLYKYKFTFDYNNNEIGFYRTNLNTKKIVHRIERAFRGKFILVILFILILVGGIYYCYKKGYILKKRAIDYNTANKNISHFSGENNIDQGYELKTDN